MIARSTLPAVDGAADGHDLSQPGEISPPPPDTEPVCETICGYPVHCAASRFPEMPAHEFEQLIASVERDGVAVPVEIFEGRLIDGRHRARAVEHLRARGAVIDLPIVEWQPKPGATVEGRVAQHNLLRRHLTDDQRAALALPMLPEIRAELALRQARTRFGSSRVGGPDSTEGNSPLPQTDGRPQRSSQEKDASSAVGALAALAKISQHKSRVAIGVLDDVAAGAIPSEELDAVARGEKPLRSIVSSRRKKSAKRVDKASSPAMAPVDAFMADVGDEDGVELQLTGEEARRQWQRVKDLFAITDHRQLRSHFAAFIAEEQRRFDNC
jgi:hypothetical protein